MNIRKENMSNEITIKHIREVAQGYVRENSDEGLVESYQRSRTSQAIGRIKRQLRLYNKLEKQNKQAPGEYFKSKKVHTEFDPQVMETITDSGWQKLQKDWLPTLEQEITDKKHTKLLEVIVYLLKNIRSNQ